MCDRSNIMIKRLKNLIDCSGKSREVIAKAIGCDVSTITKQYNGDRKLTIDFVVKYAKYFNVSTDYLLGVTDVQTVDNDIKFICNYTGLSDESVDVLKQLNKIKKYLLSILNMQLRK